MLRMVTAVTIVLLFAFSVGPAVCAQENFARITGTVFYWFTLEPMRNSIVEINTTSKQVDVAKDGEYSFNVPPGEYTITASYWKDNVLLYWTEENIAVTGTGGVYHLDLIMFPMFFENEIPIGDEILPSIETTYEPDYTPLFLATAVAIGAAGALIFYFLKIRQRKKITKVKALKEPSPVKVIGLPDDLKEVVERIRESGGGSTSWSCAKSFPTRRLRSA